MDMRSDVVKSVLFFGMERGLQSCTRIFSSERRGIV